MNRNFPHLMDYTNYPDVQGVNVFDYQNNVDYQKYNANQMTITLTNVPYDLGEVHVGNRTVSGIGNVVYFSGKEDRDAWLEAQASIRLDTKYRRYHKEDEIKIPLPFDVAARYNYIYIDYPEIPTEDDPIEYQDAPRIKRWLYFIREVKRESNNSTILVVKRDSWQTFIYDLHIKGLMLTRGHAPLKACSADKFLSNPLENTRYIYGLEPVEGLGTKITATKTAELNSGNMLACISCSSNPRGNWSDKTPAASSYIVDGNLSYFCFAMPTSELTGFLARVDTQIPQFKQTIQAVFFVSAELVSQGESFTFCNTSCTVLNGKTQQKALVNLSKELFNYPDEYKNIAKLYGSQFAHIEITDEQGNVTSIAVEDCSNSISAEIATSVAFPYISIDAHINGIKSNTINKITFKNVSVHTMNAGGAWYENLRALKIPIFEVVQDAAINYDFSTRFDRAQQSNAAEIAYQNAVASANTEKANADASASTITANAALTTAGNSSIAELNNSAQSTDVYLSNELNQANQAWNAGYTRATTNAQINYEVQSAAISAVGNVANGLASPNPVAGLISGIASAATSGLQTAAATNLATDKAELAISNSQNLVTAGNTNNTDKYNNQSGNNTAVTAAGNRVTSGQAANNAGTTRNNASRSQSTAIANADRIRSLQQGAITNGIKQAALNHPLSFGNMRDIDYSTTRPIMIQANIVTADNGTIAAAGDMILKYGYSWYGYYPFDTFNLMDKFTYWQADEIITQDLTIPDLYVDELRYFLLGGVTVWRKPEYIGHTTIYENGV